MPLLLCHYFYVSTSAPLTCSQLLRVYLLFDAIRGVSSVLVLVFSTTSRQLEIYSINVFASKPAATRALTQSLHGLQSAFEITVDTYSYRLIALLPLASCQYVNIGCGWLAFRFVQLVYVDKLAAKILLSGPPSDSLLNKLGARRSRATNESARANRITLLYLALHENRCRCVEWTSGRTYERKRSHFERLFGKQSHSSFAFV